jgi:hypothetical protein
MRLEQAYQLLAGRHRLAVKDAPLALGEDALNQRQIMAELGVRRDKAALSSGCEAHPAIRSSRKQPEQAWR